MRPGPDLRTLAGPVAVGARVSVRRGREMLALDVPATNVKVEWTEERAVPSRVEFDVAGAEWVPDAPLHPLNNYGQRVRIESVVQAGGKEHVTDMGWYLLTEWSPTDSGVRVVAMDMRQLLAESDLDWPSSPATGATLRGELNRLAYPLPVVLDGMDDQPISRDFQWGVNRLENLADLAVAFGLEFDVKPDECLHVRPVRTARHIVETYTEGVGGLLLDAPRSSQPRRPNRWIAVAEDSEGNRRTATRQVSSTPYEPGIYGLVTDRLEVDAELSQTQIDAAADRAMRAVLSESAATPLQMDLDPRIEAGDVIGVIADGVCAVCRVHAYSMVLDDPAQTMRVDVKELNW